MKKTVIPMIAGLVALSMVAPALAQNPNAPGQDRVCLVETSVPNNWNNENVVSTKYLPRKAAEAQASKRPDTLQYADYSDEPEVKDGTYADAEEFCEEFFD